MADTSASQHSWNPTIVSGATAIAYQTYYDSTYSNTYRTGIIAVATDVNVTITWYAGGNNGKVKVIHTNKLLNNTHVVEKECTTSKSSVTITNLKVGDLIVGNASNRASAYNNITNAIKAASLDGAGYYAQVFMAISDTVTISLGGASTSYSIVTFRQ